MKIEIKPSQSFLADVLCTALEGGIGYWASTGKIESDAFGYVSANVCALEDEDDWPPTKVTRDMLERGIELTLDPGFRMNAQTRASILHALLADDAGDIDAEGADCIMQALLFGSIVYG